VPRGPSTRELFAALGDRVSTDARVELLSWSVVRQMPGGLRRSSGSSTSRGRHAAALFSLDGSLLALREEVGRHNAVDKVSGSRLLARDHRGPEVLVVSGRISFEIVQKAVASQVLALVAVGAPTSLAVDLARHTHLCLVGWARDERAVVYAADDRLAG